MLRLSHKSPIVLLGLTLVVYFGTWNSADAAGPASGELNQNSALHVNGKSSPGSSHQAKIDMRDDNLGPLCQMSGGGMMGGGGIP
jgi:hypothetical protein